MERSGCRDLKGKRDDWVRRPGPGASGVGTEGGRSSLVRFHEDDPDRSFRERIQLPEFAALAAGAGDCTGNGSDDREPRIRWNKAKGAFK